jgi:hypothetical protein
MCKEKHNNHKCRNAINAITVIYERYTNHQPIDLILLDHDLSKSPHGNPVILSNDFF